MQIGNVKGARAMDAPERTENMAGKIDLLAPLAHRPFRARFAGKVISNLGDWLDILALLTLILYRWGLGSLAWGA